MASDRGGQFERDVVKAIKPLWPHARRSGKGFVGVDILNTGPFSIECKNQARDKLGEWMKQAELQAEMDGQPYPVVFHKRRMYGTHKAYVTMTVETFINLVGDMMGVDLTEHVEDNRVSDDDDTPLE